MFIFLLFRSVLVLLLGQRDDLAAAQVVEPPRRPLFGRGQEERTHRIVGVGEVTPLPAVTVDRELLAGQDEAKPRAEKRLPRVAHAHPGAVGVRQPQNGDADAVRRPVQEVVPLSRGLVDAVDVDRLQRMLLVNRQVSRPSVDLARAREDDVDSWIVVAAGLEDRELGATVDLEVGVGVVIESRWLVWPARLKRNSCSSTRRRRLWMSRTSEMLT